MARLPRIEFPGAVYHVYSRGNDRQPIFYRDEDRHDFFAILREVNSEYNWLCHSYSLMDNHYHFEIETLDGNLAGGMRQLNGIYTQHFNRHHDRVGHVFQGRYKAELIEKETYLLEVCRYIALNPVRANLVKKPEDWRWGSYRAMIGLEEPHPVLTIDWILSQFSDNIDEARVMFRDFVEKGLEESVELPVARRGIIGSREFRETYNGVRYRT